jgi:hypothetical protein
MINTTNSEYKCGTDKAIHMKTSFQGMAPYIVLLKLFILRGIQHTTLIKTELNIQ